MIIRNSFKKMNGHGSKFQSKYGNKLKPNGWQQRNEPIIHDVTSVKYNKKNKIVSHFFQD